MVSLNHFDAHLKVIHYKSTTLSQKFLTKKTTPLATTGLFSVSVTLFPLSSFISFFRFHI